MSAPKTTRTQQMQALGHTDIKVLGFKEDGTEIVLVRHGNCGNIKYNKRIENDISRNLEKKESTKLRLRARLAAKNN